MATSIFELEFHSTNVAPKGDMSLLAAPIFQHNDMHSNITQIKYEIRETKLPFLQHQCRQSLEETISHDKLTYDTNITDCIADDTL